MTEAISKQLDHGTFFIHHTNHNTRICDANMSGKISRSKLIAELKRIDKAIDGRPTVKDLNSIGEWSKRPYSREFGSWTEALEEIGYKPPGETIEIPCSNCGKTLDRTHYQVDKKENHFCNTECKGEWQSTELKGESNPVYNRVELECDWCGDSLTKRQSYAEKCDTHFCNKNCHDSWQFENAPAGENHPDRLTESAECDHCGDTFEANSHEIANGKRFCDRGCYSGWRRSSPENNPSWKGGPIETECEYCGSVTEKTIAIYEATELSFCDEVCQGKWRGENKVGERNPAWKGGWQNYYGPNWNAQRWKARERDGRQCQGCGMEEDDHLKTHGQNLHVHHIQPHRTFDNYGDANALKNLVTLCRECHHSKWEGIPLRPQLVASD